MPEVLALWSQYSLYNLMKKKIIISIVSFSVVCVAIHFLLRVSLGFSPLRIGDAIGVATAMGAKLACSGYFITGLNKAQIIDDLASYSPVNRKLEIIYDEKSAQVSASLFGLGDTTAHYREGLGCTLDIGDTHALDALLIKPISPVPEAPWPFGGSVRTLNADRQTLLDEILATDNRSGLQTRALLVVEHGNIIAESYADGFDPQTPHMGWSMAKSLTAIMLGRMQHLGLANMNDAELFPRWQSDGRRFITLENLLQMSSGLAFDETYAPGSDSTHMLFGAYSASDVVLVKRAATKPGVRFSYSSGTSNILMRWMHDELGGTPAMIEFIRNEVFMPLGMARTVLEPDPSGVFVASSYIYASARDWARLGMLMLNKGEFNGKRLLSEAWVNRAVSPNTSKNKPNYGYHFWLNHSEYKKPWRLLPEDAFFMSGNRKQYVMVAPSQNMVVVRLGWTKGKYPLEENFSKILGLGSD